jgi:hypothetical protein
VCVRFRGVLWGETAAMWIQMKILCVWVGYFGVDSN